MLEDPNCFLLRNPLKHPKNIKHARQLETTSEKKVIHPFDESKKLPAISFFFCSAALAGNQMAVAGSTMKSWEKKL